MKAIRWSGDTDRYFGPFTYARERNGYRSIAFVLGSGDGDEYPGCRLRISAFGRTLITALPPIIKPEARRVEVPEWRTNGTAPRLGRDFYFDYSEREYGFSCSEGFLQVFRGRHTMDSSTDRTWGWFLPWKAWRHVRRSFYGLDGEHVATVPDTGQRAIEDATPARTFAFKDFDGEALTATTRIEEREWRRGTGRFKWLSLFFRRKVRRSLSIEFSGETGKRKGSWKGGSIGTGIDMLPGELHEAAFRRYCTEHAMTFVNAAEPA